MPIVDTPVDDHSPEDSDSSVSDSSYDSDHASAGAAKMHATYDAESNISNVDFDVGEALPPDADECLVECSEALAALLKARIPGSARPCAKPSSGLQQTFFVLDEMCKSSLSDAAFTRMSQVIHSKAKRFWSAFFTFLHCANLLLSKAIPKSALENIALEFRAALDEMEYSGLATMMTISAHSIMHIPDIVKQFGPIKGFVWNYYVERWMHYMKRALSATIGFVRNIVQAFQVMSPTARNR
ncbi:hypothetical protein PBRA_009175 [Plasmodiophora brassicae]|uniref:DUF4218 domain-containing protein n=1 Tax=Plasmodiophora brassicae TaxID=37360 RepID=A0A0G4J606_PLABS|nr:hypothetical protein PBRA_009175 [Plasmodiophora brassicae]